MEREEFEAAVERIVRYVHAGDAFQVVPSQRFSAASPVESFSIYRGLRVVNPSPFSALLSFGDLTLVSCSPERLMRVYGQTVETRPIAGTRPRSGEPAQDERLRKELLANAKERAEHIMLVDLERNDLGRSADVDPSGSTNS